MRTLFSAFFCICLFCLTTTVFAQFTTPTIDGSLGTNEYGSHVNGDNRYDTGGRTWYMTWDDTNLYLFIDEAGSSNRVLFYIKTTTPTPINGGTNSDGSFTGFNYSNTQLSPLPFRANCFIALESGYSQLNTSDGADGWNSANTSFGSISVSGNDFEVSIPWSAITGSGRPSSFAWTGYITDNNAGGNYFSAVPSENPVGIIGTSGIRYERYFVVNNTGDGVSIKPFSRNCYVFNSASSNNSFGAIGVYDFTMNSSGLQIARLNSGGNWLVTNLIVNAGTIYFGSGGSGYGTSSVLGNLTISGGSLNMDQTNQPLNVDGSVTISGGSLVLSGTVGGDISVGGDWTRSSGSFAPNERAVFLDGASSQSINTTGGETFDYLFINNGSGVSIQNNVLVDNLLTLTSGSLSRSSSETLTLSNNAGITITNGAISFSPAFGTGTTVIYNGTSAITTGNEFPSNQSNISSVSIQNTNAASGVTLDRNLTNGNLTIASGGILTMGMFSFSGNNFTLTSGELRLAHSGGLVSALTHSGTSTFTSGVINFNSGASQSIGAGAFSLADLTIATSNTSTVLSIDSDNTFLGLSVGSNSEIDISNRQITIASGGSLTNNGTFTATGSTVLFSGTATLSGTISLNSATLSGGVNFGSSSTINGVLQLNSGGFVNTNAPTYATNSTLRYNSGTVYGRATEWSSTSGSGYPFNVQISNNTTLSLGANSGTATARQLAGNLTIDNGSTFTTNGSGEKMTATLTVLGDLTISGSMVLSDQVGADLLLGGYFNRTGTFTDNSREVTFNGTITQNLTATGGQNFSYLRINKSVGDVTLSNNLTISSRLTLSQGNISTGGNTVFITNPAADDVNNGISRTDGYIIGTINRTIGTSTGNRLFPIGVLSDYRGMNVNLTDAFDSQQDLTVSFVGGGVGVNGLPLADTSPSYTVNVTASEGYWSGSISGSAGSFVYDLDIHADGFYAVENYTELRIMHRTDNSSVWTLQGSHSAGTGSNSNPVAHRTSLTSFGEIGIGGDNADNTLPVEVVSFTAAKKSNNVVLNWETISEIENAGFELFRSQDAVSFTKISSFSQNKNLEGKGPNGGKYEFIDNDHLVSGKTYFYKLININFDGSVDEYSQILSVKFENQVTAFQVYPAFPNPFNPQTMVRIDIVDDGTVTAEIYNVQGQKIGQVYNNFEKSGSQVQFSIDMGNMSSGVYFLRVHQGRNNAVQRLMLIK